MSAPCLAPKNTALAASFLAGRAASPPCAHSPLCHMAFTSAGKLDQHMKFSPVHAISRGETASVDNSMETDTPDETSSTTIYSGTKLFWRTGLNVELIMQGHEQANTVQVSENLGREGKETEQYHRVGWAILSVSSTRGGSAEHFKRQSANAPASSVDGCFMAGVGLPSTVCFSAS